MCRIYGFLSSQSNALSHRIPGVVAAQLHGGPDDQRYIATSHYGVGCNRLAITDLTGGQQPYSNIPNIHVVLNGEIYNHNELRKDLESRGYRFRDRCDGTILPALYAEYGDKFPEYLDGMFSIAVLDLRFAKPTFLLATDPAGIKPVYYSDNQNSVFAFATEIPALLQFGIA